MARFKKKKSEPTPDPAQPAKEEPEKALEAAPESEAPESEVPAEAAPAEPVPGTAERSENDRNLNKLFWLRVGLAVIAGAAATFIFEDLWGEERRWASIAFMIIVFLGTIFVAKSMKMQLPSSDRKKIVTQGIGSYIFIYLFMWIVSYTLVNLPEASTGIISPISSLP